MSKKFFITLFLFVLVFTPYAFSYAQTAADVQSQIDQKNADIQSLEKEIAAYQAQLDSLARQKNSLSTSIKELDITRKNLNAQIAVTQNKIDKTNLQIKNLSSDINTKETNINNNIEAIKLEIKQTNEFEQGSLVQSLLGADDLSTAWNDIDNMATVRDKIRTDIYTLQKVKGRLEDTRTASINAKNNLSAFKSQLSDQQKIVVQNTNEKNQLLAQTKNNESTYQKLLKDRIAKRDAFEKEIEDYESQLKFIIDPSKLPAKGVLSWPLTKIFVTQLFGKTADSGRLYTSGTHSGVDFKASIGTPVMAMADGVVLGTGNTDLTCYGGSFGKFVFIQYNDGLSSTFGHLSLIKSQVGDHVARGEVVGYSGATGHVTGPHLHVSLYVASAVKMDSLPSAGCTGKSYIMPLAPKNAYLDPMVYLPPYSANSSQLDNNVKE